MECRGERRQVYFTVQRSDHCEAAQFRTDTPADEVKGQHNIWQHNINPLKPKLV
jgi:hypothetical protein